MSKKNENPDYQAKKSHSNADLTALWDTSVADVLKWKKGTDIRSLDFNSAPGYRGTKQQGEAALNMLQPELAELQEKLFAQGKTGGNKSVLLVIQGLDTAGKGGAVKHVIGLVDPQGIMLKQFGRPTENESAHHFLWRIEKALPKPGYIGVFDRSQYEQVLVVRTDELEDEATWRAHYGEINDFEKEVEARDIKIIKIALIVSKDEQKKRLLARLDHPNKFWKYNPNDLNTRAKFAEYLDAYEEMFDQTSTALAPWYVIPADKKWYARLAITQILLDTLRGMDLQWPAPQFDVAEQKRLVAAS